MGVLDKAPQLAMIFLGGVIVCLVGLADDRWSLSPWLRLAIEAGVALMLVLSGVSVELFIESRVLRGLITVVWIVGLINAFNFLDNMDGLSAGVAAIIAVFFSVVAFQTVHYFVGGALCCLIGALVGFLVFNFPPASIFMGDCGSMTIGYSLAVLTVQFTFFQAERPYFPIVVPLMMFGVPLFDTITVTWIRIRSGRSPFQRRHEPLLAPAGGAGDEAVAGGADDLPGDGDRGARRDGALLRQLRGDPGHLRADGGGLHHYRNPGNDRAAEERRVT